MEEQKIFQQIQEQISDQTNPNPNIHPDINTTSKGFTFQQNKQQTDIRPLTNTIWTQRNMNYIPNDAANFQILNTIFNSDETVKYSNYNSTNADLYFSTSPNIAYSFIGEAYVSRNISVPFAISWPSGSYSIYLNDSLFHSQNTGNISGVSQLNLILETGWNTLEVLAWTPCVNQDLIVTSNLIDIFEDWRNFDYSETLPPSGLSVSIDINAKTIRDTNINILRWDHNQETNLVGYKVYRRGPYDNLMEPPSGLNFINVVNSGIILSNTSYYYRVSSYSTDGESLSSDNLYTTTSGYMFPPIVSVSGQYDGAGTLVSGVLYTYAMTSIDRFGQETYESINSDFIFDLNDSMLLSWSGVAQASGYHIYRGISGVFTNVSFVTNVASGTLSFLDTGYALSAGGIPSGINHTHNKNSIQLSWDPIVGATGYYIYKSLTSGLYPKESYVGLSSVNAFLDTGITTSEGKPTLYSFQSDVKAGTNKYNDIGLKQQQYYDYKLRSVNHIGRESDFSGSVGITAGDITPPGIPTNFVGYDDGKVAYLSWTNPTDDDFFYCNIYQCATSSGTFANIGNTKSDHFAVYIGPNATQFFTVSALDFNLNESAQTSSVEISTVVTNGSFTVTVNPDPTSSGIVTIYARSSLAMSGIPTCTITQFGAAVTSVTLSGVHPTYSGVYSIIPTADGYATAYVSGINTTGGYNTGSDTFLVDTTSPQAPSININNGATSTADRMVTLSLSAVDATTAVSGVSLSADGSNWTGWIPYSAYYPYQLPIANSGMEYKTVYAKFRDSLQNESATANDSIFLNTRISGVFNVTISSDPMTSGTLNITADSSLSMLSFPICKLQTAINPWTKITDMSVLPSADGWTPGFTDEGRDASVASGILTINTLTQGTATGYYHIANPGLISAMGYTIEAKIKVIDTEGASMQSACIRLYESTVQLNYLFLNKTSVKITGTAISYNMDTTDVFHVYRIVVLGTVIQLYVDGDLKITDTCATTATAVSDILFGDLSATNGVNANTQWDYVKYYTGGAFAPEDSLSIDLSGGPNNYTGSVDIVPGLSGVSYITVSGINYSYGSCSGIKSFTIDTDAPSGVNLSINSGAIYTNKTSVDLAILATDPTTTVDYMALSNDNITYANWIPYATKISYELPSTDGTKTVYCKFKDSAGNPGANMVYDSIILDTTAPSISGISPADGSTSILSIVSITGLLYDNGAGINTGSVVLKVGNTLLSPSITATSFSGITVSLNDGDYDVYFSIFDNAGNKSERQWGFKVNAVAPDVPTKLTAQSYYNGIALEWTRVTNDDLERYELRTTGDDSGVPSGVWTSLVPFNITPVVSGLTTSRANMFVHAKLEGDTGQKTGVSKWYQARSADTAGNVSDWTSPISGVSSIIDNGDIAANAITANKIKAGEIETYHISAIGLDAEVIKAGKLRVEYIDASDGMVGNNLIRNSSFDYDNFWTNYTGSPSRAIIQKVVSDIPNLGRYNLSCSASGTSWFHYCKVTSNKFQVYGNKTYVLSLYMKDNGSSYISYVSGIYITEYDANRMAIKKTIFSPSSSQLDYQDNPYWLIANRTNWQRPSWTWTTQSGTKTSDLTLGIANSGIEDYCLVYYDNVKLEDGASRTAWVDRASKGDATYVVAQDNTGDFDDFVTGYQELIKVGSGVLYIKNGTYPISSSLELMDNLHLIGENNQYTQLLASGMTTSDSIFTDRYGQNDVSFENLYLKEITSVGINPPFISAGTNNDSSVYNNNFKIDNCIIDTAGQRILALWYRASGVTFINNTVKTGYVWMGSGINCNISNNNFDTLSSGAGLICANYYLGDSIISNNISRTTYMNDLIRGGNSCIYNNLIIKNNIVEGGLFRNEASSVIQNSLIDGNHVSELAIGLDIIRASGTRISNNNFDAYVQCLNCYNTLIDHNVFRMPDSYILISGLYTTFENNIITNYSNPNYYHDPKLIINGSGLFINNNIYSNNDNIYSSIDLLVRPACSDIIIKDNKFGGKIDIQSSFVYSNNPTLNSSSSGYFGQTLVGRMVAEYPFGTVLCVSGASPNYYRPADSMSGVYMPARGILVSNSGVEKDHYGEILYAGEVTKANWAWSVGSGIYTSGLGTLTQNIPSVAGQYSQCVGYAKNPTTAVFNFMGEYYDL